MLIERDAFTPVFESACKQAIIPEPPRLPDDTAVKELGCKEFCCGDNYGKVNMAEKIIIFTPINAI